MTNTDQKWNKLADECGIPPKQRAAWRQRLEKRFPPRRTQPRSEPAVLEAAGAKIAELIASLRPRRGRSAGRRVDEGRWSRSDQSRRRSMDSTLPA
jgi:hypothetical protein